ncbi:hypothetical protein QF046_001771 [Microbacterium sp. W4I4]|uniref:C39 family peptidase n=1 Tax=Microbacterium sp. W4I4 TaxID=3042295 RepID=UPI0027898158|nr:C39 family peptidase [Microbacterium sp. W4I4]MDQ0614130.1 hypothetical protein [Microbacterium sp. W4I4]
MDGAPPMPTSPAPTVPTWRTLLMRADTRVGWEGPRWTSDILEPGFAADRAIASWNLDAGTTAQVDIRSRRPDGAWHPWQSLATWGEPGARTSPARSAAKPGEQGIPVVDTDVLTAPAGAEFDAVQLRITLGEGQDADGDRSAGPLHLATVNVTASADPAPLADTDAIGGILGAAASVRPLSQRAYPARDDLGGGPVWCSPTSLTMVALAWGTEIPTAAPEEIPEGADPHVPWVARSVYDIAYEGTGNWSFNAALAGSLGLEAFVTRLPGLRAARTLTDAGVPIVASIRFGKGELSGADYGAPTGHLVVIRGFTADGDVLVADPANPGGAAGLRTYPRAAFDTAWSYSRRTVYVVTPRGHELPAVVGDAAW